jgi:hypothetical protein
MDEMSAHLNLEDIPEQWLHPVQKRQLNISQSIYFLPVSSFPLPIAELSKIREFCGQLIAGVQQMNARLQLEVIIKQSSLYPDLIDHFVDRARHWIPKAKFSHSTTPAASAPANKSRYGEH